MGERLGQQRESPGLTRRRFLQFALASAATFWLDNQLGNSPFFLQENRALAATDSLPRRVNGLNFSSWIRGELQGEPAQRALKGMREVRPNLVGIKVTQYQANFNSTDIFPTNNTADFDDLRLVLDLAHQEGYKVMLAPQINLTSDPKHWHGEIGANFSDTEWQKWFASYQRMINGYADFAANKGVELFVVGNEYIQASKRSEDWKSTIAGVKDRFGGPITYAAHFHEFTAIPWWSEVDLLGLNPYYELMTTDAPTDPKQFNVLLKTAWGNIIPTIEPTVKRFGKDLIFPEVGYPSVKGASKQPWNFSLIGNPNTELGIMEQAVCYQALYESFWKYPWWRGVVWWHWNTDPNINGKNNKEYSPRGKVAAEVMAYYSKALAGG